MTVLDRSSMKACAGTRGVTPQKQPRSVNKEPEAEFQVTAEGEMGNHSVNVLLSAALYTGKR